MRGGNFRAFGGGACRTAHEDDCATDEGPDPDDADLRLCLPSTLLPVVSDELAAGRCKTRPTGPDDDGGGGGGGDENDKRWEGPTAAAPAAAAAAAATPAPPAAPTNGADVEVGGEAVGVLGSGAPAGADCVLLCAVKRGCVP